MRAYAKPLVELPLEKWFATILLQAYAAATATGAADRPKVLLGTEAPLVMIRFSISWQSKSDVQTEFARLDPARAVPI